MNDLTRLALLAEMTDDARSHLAQFPGLGLEAAKLGAEQLMGDCFADAKAHWTEEARRGL